jgi:hypothetical protein
MKNLQNYQIEKSSFVMEKYNNIDKKKLLRKFYNKIVINVK